MMSLTAKYLFYVNLSITINDYRSTYNNLKLSYQHFGQFQYSYLEDQGECHIYCLFDDDFIKYTSRIEENNSSLIRSIIVWKEGKIVENEYSNWSEFCRWRVILENGFCEEYSIHRTTRFGIRKVVYPDGQQFTNEVYDYERGWNAIGEETYAIQNKRIPYLLGDNEMKEYIFVTEDGLLNTIDLGWSYNKEILSSSSSESNDGD